jgi:hypothetical protein
MLPMHYHSPHCAGTDFGLTTEDTSYFQVLEHTLGLPAAQWRVLDKAHSARNSAEYEGYFEVDEQLLAEVLKIELHPVRLTPA